MIQSIARNPLMEGKSALRASLLERRGQQGTEQKSAALNDALGARLAQLLVRYPATRCIGYYWPLAGEFDARGVIVQWLSEDTKRIAALPVVVAPRAPLAFHAWQPDAAMKKGRYGIPVPDEERIVTPDVLLIPCVGFDTARYRLGYGGGYYDRTLAAWPASESMSAQRPVTLGVAFESTKCDALPRETHDIPLDAIVTEAAIY